jgi:predicted metal-dependent phosphoesterase TrpH
MNTAGTLSPPVADLHLHTRCSDGALSPEELLQKAAQRGLCCVAFTDHDTVEGYEAASALARQLGIELVSGIEVSCYEAGRELHVLGYGIDVAHRRVREHMERARERRWRRLERMVQRCRRLGLMVTLEEATEEAPGAVVGRPHLAAALLRRGYCQSLAEAFARYLEPGRPAYEPPEEFPVVRALELIHATGGVAILAHPGRAFQNPRLLLELLRRGFDGVEVYHPQHGSVLRSYYGLLARQHRWLVSGGSDYHGTRPYDEWNFGRFGISAQELERFCERLAMLGRRCGNPALGATG